MKTRNSKVLNLVMEFLVFIAFSLQFSALENPSVHPVRGERLAQLHNMAEQLWENDLIGTWSAKAGRAEGALGGRGCELGVTSSSRGGDLNWNRCCNCGDTFGRLEGPGRVEVVGASMVVSASGQWAPR